MPIGQLIPLVLIFVVLILAAGLLLRRFRKVSLKWWLIRSTVAIAPVGIGFVLAYSVTSWNRNGVAFLSMAAAIAAQLNWHLAKGIADHYADEFISDE